MGRLDDAVDDAACGVSKTLLPIDCDDGLCVCRILAMIHTVVRERLLEELPEVRVDSALVIPFDVRFHGCPVILVPKANQGDRYGVSVRTNNQSPCVLALHVYIPPQSRQLALRASASLLGEEQTS